MPTPKRLVSIVGGLGVYPMVRLSLPGRRLIVNLCLHGHPVPRKVVDLPPAVRPPFTFLHADKLIGEKVRVSGAGGRYPSALCGRCVL